jgi:hypothetical protein
MTTIRCRERRGERCSAFPISCILIFAWRLRVFKGGRYDARYTRCGNGRFAFTHIWLKDNHLNDTTTSMDSGARTRSVHHVRLLRLPSRIPIEHMTFSRREAYQSSE